jgi:hypothetical protein
MTLIVIFTTTILAIKSKRDTTNQHRTTKGSASKIQELASYFPTTSSFSTQGKKEAH